MLSNVQTHYRKVTKERPQNPEILVIIIFPVFSEHVSAALLLLETAVIALIWVIIQLKAFLAPLLVTLLQLKEKFRYRNGCTNHSVILFGDKFRYSKQRVKLLNMKDWKRFHY